MKASERHDRTEPREIKIESSGSSINSAAWFLAGVATGSVAIYFLDSAQGARRRALLKDKGVGLRNDVRDYGEKLTRHTKNRMMGLKARIGNLRSKNIEVDDETLIQRIRSEFGRKVRHAKSIEVSVENGAVTLSGPILSSEANDLIDCVERVPGVKEVINCLNPHETSENIPGLQGEGKPYFRMH